MARLFSNFRIYSMTVGMFFVLTLTGIVMQWFGDPAGRDVWQMFGMALAAFVKESRQTNDPIDGD